MADRETILRRVRALLDQAESTTYPEEAKTFTAKAAELMDAYAIDEAMVADAKPGESESPDVAVIWIDAGPYQGPRIDLCWSVFGQRGCKGVMWGDVRRNPDTGRKAKKLEFVGFPTDLAFAEQLFTSLLVQAATEVAQPDNQAAMARECHAPAHKVAWKNAYMLGYRGAVVARLTEARKAEESAAAARHAEQAAAGRSVAVVLASRNEQVNAEYKRRHPRVGSGSGSSAGRGSTGSGFGNGYAAGGRANLGGSGSVNRGNAGSLGR